jgi:hypothetical protein
MSQSGCVRQIGHMMSNQVRVKLPEEPCIVSFYLSLAHHCHSFLLHVGGLLSRLGQGRITGNLKFGMWNSCSLGLSVSLRYQGYGGCCFADVGQTGVGE